MKNIKHLARRIICKHTEGMMACTELHPDNNRTLYEHMLEECAYIITDKLINGEITPMEYNDLRNEVADMLWGIFKNCIDE